ncbi:MAG: ABC transporter substrate-binding protein [Candidatus Bathyarchaeales archaeon]
MSNKKAIGKIAAIIIVVVLVAAIGGGVYYYQYTQKVASIKNPDTMIEATIGEPETLDPAWAYDTASGEAIFNMYDTLIFFDREKVDQFVPKIAEQVPSVANGLVKDDGKTIIFPIRQGIKAHGGGTITPEDVEYSFERAIIQERDGGPTWMLLEPLLGVDTLAELGDLSVASEAAAIGEMIDAAVEVDGNNVVFKLAKSFPLTTFMQIWSQTWASVVDKESAIEHGAWPGNKDNWAEVFATYHNPEVPELQEADCGSGPFVLERWEHGKEVSFVRFDDYWAGPAKLKRAVIKSVDEWATRKLMFQQGDADIVYVPRQYTSEIEGAAGIRCIKDLPQLTIDAVLFTFEVDSNSPYIGSGKLDGNGVPPDFFTDIDLRKAFAYSFDWDTYIKEAMLGEAKHVPGPIPEGLPFFNPNQETYTFDLTKAEEHFKAAWNGQVWEKGFTLEILYNTGNIPRKTAAEILKDNIQGLNPKFQITVTEVDWPTYLRAMVKSQLPVFIIGWLADFPDPHNFVHPYMHSAGAFAAWQKYSNPTVDELIAEGISETDQTARKDIYYELQKIYYEDIPSFVIDQPLGRHWERDWVQGWYYNPMFPTQLYFYALWKGY